LDTKGYELLWFSLAECQVLTRAALLFRLLNWTRERNMMKSLWVKIRTGRDHSPITIMGKTDLMKLI